MNRKVKRLPDAELEIMLAVWLAQEEPVSAAYILERIKNKRSWQLQTLLTVLARLVEKGFLLCEKQGRFNFYRAAITKEAYEQEEGKTMLETFYSNSFQKMVNSLLDGNVISQDDLRELYQYLEEHKED